MGGNEEITFPPMSCMLKGGGVASFPSLIPPGGQLPAPGKLWVEAGGVDGFGVSAAHRHTLALSPEWVYSIFRQHSCPRSKLDCLSYAFYHVYN